MRNEANYSMYINTGQEFDGSDSEMSPDEAYSWGKIQIDVRPVIVSADSSLVLPLIISQMLARGVEAWKEEVKDCVC